MSRAVPFIKMSGAGNDFVMLAQADFDRLPGDQVAWVRQVCRRRLSVGGDGLIVVGVGEGGRVSVRFFNPDGSEAFCGNGSRCAARFAYDQGLAGARMELQTAHGPVEARVAEGAVPIVELTLAAPVRLGAVALGEIEGEHVEVGVPHVVAAVDQASRFDLERWGPRVSHDPRFGEAGTNFNVLSRSDDQSWALRTWERGVEGETLACGSGAVAAAMVARLAGADETVRLSPTSGVPLEVDLPGPPEAPRLARLRGDARFVVRGEIDTEATCGF